MSTNKPLIAVEEFEKLKPVSLTAEFHLLKSQALEEAKAVVTVGDAESQAVATAATSTVKGILKQIEASRKAVGNPVLTLTREINEIAKQASVDLAAEQVRLELLLSAHYRAEAKLAKEEEEMRQRFEAKRQARLAEQAKQATTTQEQEKIEAKAATPVAVAPVQAPPKAEKMTVKKTWKFNLNDIKALHNARPELVKMEENTAAILAEIRGGMRCCPGLTIYEDTAVIVRT